MLDLVREPDGEATHAVGCRSPGGQRGGCGARSQCADHRLRGRRFATYKRATLLFRDQERIKRLLHDPARPVQLIFSGKAHPADEPGKAFIQAVCQMSKQPDFAGKIIFVEDYDANIARHLVAGVDVWLNNPRRPLEASGTSGQKAGLNGVPNFSVLDGWWREGYDGHNGWAIGAEREYPNEAAEDEADALSLYSTLENVIVPLFYERDIVTDLPEGWLAMMRASMSTVAPDFSFDRMLKEYVSKFYLPAGVLGRRVDGPSYAGARALAAWEARVRAGWDQVSLTAAGPISGEMSVGKPLEVREHCSRGRSVPATSRWSLSSARWRTTICPLRPSSLCALSAARVRTHMSQPSTRRRVASSATACASVRITPTCRTRSPWAWCGGRERVTNDE